MRPPLPGIVALAIAVGTAAAAPRHAAELDELLAWEEARRAATAWSARRRADLGPDPYRLLATGHDDRLVGLLRGADALVLLGADGREIDRVPAPPSPTGLARLAGDEVLVVGEQSPELARFRVERDRLVPLGSAPVPGTFALRDVVVAGERAFVLDVTGHRILSVDPAAPSHPPRVLAPCEGGIDLAFAEGFAIANCLLEGSLRVLDADGRPLARMVHDGPFWSVAALGRGDHLLVAGGGVEDRPLDRRDGSFGHIDSFAFVYRVDVASGETRRLASVNLSELGVVTPKWIALSAEGGDLHLRVSGYASEGALDLAWPAGDLERPFSVARSPLPPGTTDVEGGIAADPLLDAWVVLADPSGPVRVGTRGTRSVESHVGEALFFTSLLAPWNESAGRKSRFTCETCHHEGYVDGRTHYTGRGDVHATTKPLVGLHGNRPYFSRALDPTMARMVHNEFRVANAGNERDPWFALRREDFPWLLAIEGVPEAMSPLFLRRSLLAFLVDFDHAPNPAARGRASFTPLERRGAEVFRDDCESCHAARLVSDDPSTQVPFAEWEANLFSGATIVWGRAGREKTGVTPYVHDDGARVPSLRRLYKKRPYFTNGSARDLDDVLLRAAATEQGFRHAGAPDGRRPTEEERRALLAFLALL